MTASILHMVGVGRVSVRRGIIFKFADDTQMCISANSVLLLLCEVIAMCLAWSYILRNTQHLKLMNWGSLLGVHNTSALGFVLVALVSG